MCLSEAGNSSHFRGGIITWKPSGNQILISYRVSFRRSFSSNHFCNDTSISSATLLPGEGSLSCFSGCSVTLSSMSYYCTDYSVNEDWTTGQQSFNYNFPAIGSNNFTFGYTSCCWIGSLVVGDSTTWSLQATANLERRNDTGKINSSPISQMQPIIRLKYGCQHSLKIPVADEDGDIVTCRWSTTNSECAGVCNAFPGSILDSVACVLHYNATGNTGWYAVALQIEDFATGSQTTALSSISLQFLVVVFTSADPCTDQPQLVPTVFIDGQLFYITLYTTLNETIIARSGSNSTRITEINTVSPVGMIKSELLVHGNSGREWFVTVAWTPTESQLGSHIFCFSAIDSSGQTSDQTCVTLVVNGSVNPAEITTELITEKSSTDLSTRTTESTTNTELTITTSETTSTTTEPTTTTSTTRLTTVEPTFTTEETISTAEEPTTTSKELTDTTTELTTITAKAATSSTEPTPTTRDTPSTTTEPTYTIIEPTSTTPEPTSTTTSLTKTNLTTTTMEKKISELTTTIGTTTLPTMTITRTTTVTTETTSTINSTTIPVPTTLPTTTTTIITHTKPTTTTTDTSTVETTTTDTSTVATTTTTDTTTVPTTATTDTITVSTTAITDASTVPTITTTHTTTVPTTTFIDTTTLPSTTITATTTVPTTTTTDTTTIPSNIFIDTTTVPTTNTTDTSTVQTTTTIATNTVPTITTTGTTTTITTSTTTNNIPTTTTTATTTASTKYTVPTTTTTSPSTITTKETINKTTELPPIATKPSNEPPAVTLESQTITTTTESIATHATRIQMQTTLSNGTALVRTGNKPDGLDTYWIIIIVCGILVVVFIMLCLFCIILAFRRRSSKKDLRTDDWKFSTDKYTYRRDWYDNPAVVERKMIPRASLKQWASIRSLNYN